MAIETPRYHLIKKSNRFELREYEPYLEAQVSVTASDHRAAASRGFGVLADFIFGNNTANHKISMTSPVSAQQTSERIAMTAPVTVSGTGEYTVAFSMPSRYSIASLPQPNNPGIKIIQHPNRRMAVIRFSGFFQQRNFDRHISKLKDWIQAEGYLEKGLPIVAGYNPPFTPWFLKHNEILIEVG